MNERLEGILQEIRSGVVQLERELAKHPDSTVLRVNMKSVSKERFLQLQNELRRALEECPYTNSE